MGALGRIRRLLVLVDHLRSGQTLNSGQLARLCHVSRRTVFRDVRMLQESGLPVLYDEAEQGYRMPAGAFLPPTDLTLEETLTLIVLAKSLAEDDAGLPLKRWSGPAAAKLLSNLPSRLQAHVSELTDSITMKLPPHHDFEADDGDFDRFTKAAAANRAVRVEYDSFTEKERITTQIDPYHLFFSRRSWYVIGFSSLHQEVRTFNLSRMHSTALLDRTFHPPADFSLSRFLGKAWHMIRQEPYGAQVTVRFAQKVAHNVADVVWHSTQQLRWEEDGTLLFSVEVDGLDEISWWILGYGDQAEVLEPPELRTMIARHVCQMQQTYAQELRSLY